MIKFSSLSSEEKALTMLMAYFNNVSLSKSRLAKLSAQVMLPALYERVFNKLKTSRIFKVEQRYHYSGSTSYKLKQEMVVPAIIELFKPENKTLLTSFRALFKNYGKSYSVDSLVRFIVSIVSPKEVEASKIEYGIDVESFYQGCLNIFEEKEYKEFFISLPDKIFSSLLNIYLLDCCKADKVVDWTYLTELTIAARAEKRDTVPVRELQGVFAFYYYLGTGEINIDLQHAIANSFTLQILAINALYKGNYPEAYKLYTKALAENNKAAPKKGIFVNPVCNYYYALTLILTNTEASFKKLNTLFGKSGTFRNMDSYFLLEPLKSYFCDSREPSISEKEYFAEFISIDKIAAAWLTLVICQHLGVFSKSIEPPSVHPNWAFLRYETRFSNNRESLSTLQSLFGGSPLLSRLEIKSAWEVRLEKLIDSANADNDKGEQDSKETKFLYLLRYNYIVPILKRRLKKGNWSMGKELSIHALKTLENVELDAGDRSLISALDEWDHKIHLSSYIKYLINCDHVYTGDTFDLQAVSIHEEKPCLIIEKKRDHTFKVSTNLPELVKDNSSSFYYKKNSDTDYSVFIPSGYERKVYKEILSQEIYPAEAEPLFVKLISTLGGKTEIHSNMVAELDNLERLNVSPRITLRIVSANDMFRVTASIHVSNSLSFVPGKGNVTTISEQSGKKIQLVRNLKQEHEYLKIISGGLVEIGFFDEGEEWMPDSITDALSIPLQSMLAFLQWCKIHEDVCVMEWAEGDKISYHPSISCQQVHIYLGQKNGWFEVEGNVEINDGQILSLHKLLELMHQSGKERFIRIGDKEFITLSSQLSRLLKRIDAVTNENRTHLQMAPAAVTLLGEFLDDDSLDIKCNAAIHDLRQRIEESSKETPSVPNTLQAHLRDYQEEGFEWMSKLTSWGAGVCLADDMGLGKTIQTITLLLEQEAKGASLIVAPASVVPNWRNELKRFAPSLKVTLLNQSEDRTKDIEEAKAGEVLVITYALLTLLQKELTSREWNIICLDEAHTIKNANTKMSKTAMLLHAQRKVILTGTPIQNHLSELWNLFQFINPSLLGSAEQFKKKFIQPIENDHSKERQSQLRRLISPFLLRRTKGDVIDELPKKNEIKLPVELSSDEMAMYEIRRREIEERVREGETDRMSMLAEITRLRQMACSCSLVDKKWKLPSSKVLSFIDLAEGLNDSGNRALVFSQFTSFFGEIRKAMDKAKLPYLYLDGSTTMMKREQLVKEFQSGKCPFFLISLKAGGLGLNLTGANYVIHLDPWWNPAIEQQATDRAYRIGQQQDVTVYHLISQHTIEEKILRLHRTKRILADSLLEGGEMSHAMTQEELLELLQEE